MESAERNRLFSTASLLPAYCQPTASSVGILVRIRPGTHFCQPLPRSPRIACKRPVLDGCRTVSTSTIYSPLPTVNECYRTLSCLWRAVALRQSIVHVETKKSRHSRCGFRVTLIKNMHAEQSPLDPRSPRKYLDRLQSAPGAIQ